MGLFKCAGQLCASPGHSEKIKGSVFSNRGAIVSIILKMDCESTSTGTGILIHRALVLTTHGTLPSITAAQESDILITQRGMGDSEEYGRKLAPERFFITSSVLDLTVVACDPTETEVVQPLCLHNSLAPCLDFGSVVYLLGRQRMEEQGKDLMVGDGRIIVETDTLIKFSTDGSVWSPGSAGFDIYGNLAFMICDPKKLVSSIASPHRKRTAAAAFWRKDLPKQFGIPVPIVRHWLSQHWEGSIEELDRPRVPARLKVCQKEQSVESSSSPAKFKRTQKQKEEIIEFSSNLEMLKRAQKQKEEDEEVSSIPVGPVSAEIQGTQMEKKNVWTIPIVSHNLNVGRSGIPEENGNTFNVGRSNDHGRKRENLKELQGKSNNPAQQKEQHLDKSSIFSEYPGGPQKEEHHLSIVSQKEQDAEQPTIAERIKVPPKEEGQDLFVTKVACEESMPAQHSETHKVTIPAPQIEIQKEKQQHKEIIPIQPIDIPKENQQHLDINFPNVAFKEIFPAHPTEIPKDNQHHSEINFPEAACKENSLAQPTEITGGNQQYLDINFPKVMCKETLLAGSTEIPNDSQHHLDINFPKVMCKEMIPTQPIVNRKGKQQILDINFPPKQEKEKDGKMVTLQFREPRSSIRIEHTDIEERKQAEEDPSSMQEVLKIPKAECKEPIFPGQSEKCREKLMIFSEVKEPTTSICFQLEDLDDKRPIQEDTSSRQEVWKRTIDESEESQIPGQHKTDAEKSAIFEKFKGPMSSIHIELKQLEQNKQTQETELNLQKIRKRLKAEGTESDVLSLHKKHGEKPIKQFKEPMSSIRTELKHAESKKLVQGEPPCLQEVWKRPMVEYTKSNFPVHRDKETDKSMVLAQFKDPLSRSIRVELRPSEGKREIQEGPSSLQGLWKRPKGECTESQFPALNERYREKASTFAHLKEPMSSIPLEVKHIVEVKQVQEGPLRLLEVLESPKAMEDAYQTKEGAVAESEAKEDCFGDELAEDFANQLNQNSTLSHASSRRDTDSSDVETMYSAETRESRNYSPRESNRKKNLQQSRYSQSSLSSSRGVRNWNCNVRNSLPGRSRSALPIYNNHMHRSCTRKISLQMPSYKCPDYFGPTVSSIMKKRNPDPVNNTKATVVQLSPRWIF